MSGRLCFTVNGNSYHVVLQENPLVEKITAMCPFEKEDTRNSDIETVSR